MIVQFGSCLRQSNLKLSRFALLTANGNIKQHQNVRTIQVYVPYYNRSFEWYDVVYILYKILFIYIIQCIFDTSNVYIIYIYVYQTLPALNATFIFGHISDDNVHIHIHNVNIINMKPKNYIFQVLLINPCSNAEKQQEQQERQKRQKMQGSPLACYCSINSSLACPSQLQLKHSPI